jgi:iron(III) transport system substrate-binding protein
MMAIDRRSFVASTLAAAALTPRSAFAQNEYEKSLYEAAKKEGELTWYIAHYTSETAERFGRTFTEKYPGVKVNVVRTTAQVAYQRLSQDIQANVPNCDVFATTDIGHCVSLKQRGLLLSFRPKGVEEIAPIFRDVDKDGQFHTTSATFVSILHNTNKVKAEDAPKSWKGLLDPKWVNQVAVGHPGFSGFVGIWTVQMKKLFGWSYFETLAKHKPQIGRSIIDTVTMLSSGERMVAAGPGGLAYLQASRGNPVGVIIPEEGAVLMSSPTSIMKNARHPNASKLFVEFLHGKEAGEIVRDEYGSPLRLDVEPRPGVMRVNEMKLIQPSVDEIVKGIPEAIEQWRDTFGI